MLVPSIFGRNLHDDFFDDLFNFPTAQSFHTRSGGLMNTDVKELDDHYELILELPGFEKEDISAELKDGYLTVRAVRNEEKNETDEGKYLRRERYVGQCQRNFYVGEKVTQEDIKAAFTNGVLKVTVPKVEDRPELENKKVIAIE